MNKPYDDLIKELDAKIPRDCVSEREAGQGRKLSYLEGWYVIDRLNKVIGHGNWSYATASLTNVFNGQVQDRYGKDIYSTSYIALIELRVRIDNAWSSFSDYGYGDGTDKANPGKAHELAVKEAVTDGLKRCAKNLGMSFGLALYDKTQENVSDEKERPRVLGQSQTKRESPVAQASSGSSTEQGASPQKKEAPGTRESLNKAISSTAYTLVNGLKRLTANDLKNYLATTYKKEKKEELTDTEAKEFLKYLKSHVEMNANA